MKFGYFFGDYFFTDENDKRHEATPELIVQHPQIVEAFFNKFEYYQTSWPDELKESLNEEHIIELQLKGYPI